MSRTKLKEYQNTYAETMAKHGLQRGIEGSEAKHINASQWYRELFLKNEDLKENIETLLRQQEQAKQELSKTKGEIKTEKLKSTAVEVGTSIIDGLGSMIGTSKVKKQQYEIDGLKSENQNLKQEITGLNRTINRERQEHEKSTGELNGKINRINDWFPDTPQLIRMGEYCMSVGFTEQMAKDLVNMKPVYSPASSIPMSIQTL